MSVRAVVRPTDPASVPGKARRRLIQGLPGLLLPALTTMGPAAWAQTVTRILLGFRGGTLPDQVARRFAERLSATGRVVSLDARFGAEGRAAITELRSAVPDGGTLLLAPGAIATLYPALYRKPGYDERTDLAPVSTVAEMSLGLAAGPSVPASVDSLQAFIQWCRIPGTRVTIGSPGTGSTSHVLATLLASRAGFDWAHMPSAGVPRMLSELSAGRLSAVVLPEDALRQPAAKGALRLLATSGPERSPFTPQVPTIVEQGLPDIVLQEWFGFFAPGSTPPATLDARAEEIRKICSDPAFSAAMAAMALRSLGSQPQQMAERVAREAQQWMPVIRDARIVLDA